MKKNELSERFAKAFAHAKNIARAEGMTITLLLAYLGMTTQRLREITNGSATPSFIIIKRMAEKFGVNPNYIFGYSPVMLLRKEDKISPVPQTFTEPQKKPTQPTADSGLTVINLRTDPVFVGYYESNIPFLRKTLTTTNKQVFVYVDADGGYVKHEVQ